MFSLNFWTVETAGKPRRWFGTWKEANAFAKEQFDFSEDGVPFITQHSFEEVSELCGLLDTVEESQ
jgi:hypothetical protein